jgi:hypothetical protein
LFKGSECHLNLRHALANLGKIAIVMMVIIVMGLAGYEETNESHTMSTSDFSKTIVIGMTFSPSYSGLLYLNNAWVEYVNSHGGLVDKNGVHHNVTVIAEDDYDNLTTTLNDYRLFATKNVANILISPYNSQTSLELLPISEKNQLPLIVSASEKSMWAGSYSYAVTPLGPYWSNDTTSAWAASYFSILNSTGWASTIAFVAMNTTLAIDVYKSGIWLANHTDGLGITSQQILQPTLNNPNFSSAISQILHSNDGKAPDIVFCSMSGTLCAEFITQSESQGVVPKQWYTIECGAPFVDILESRSISMQNITTSVFWMPSFSTNYSGTSALRSITAEANSWITGNNSLALNLSNYPGIGVQWEIFQMINASIAQIPNVDFSSQLMLNWAINNALHYLDVQTSTDSLQIQGQGFGTMGLVTVQFENGNINIVAPSNLANETYVHQ